VCCIVVREGGTGCDPRILNSDAGWAIFDPGAAHELLLSNTNESATAD
jgi:hypothetical protein